MTYIIMEYIRRHGIYTVKESHKSTTYSPRNVICRAQGYQNHTKRRAFFLRIQVISKFIIQIFNECKLSY